MTNIEIFIEILKTLPIVFLVYVSTAVISMPLGILGALGYTSNNKILKSALSFYTWIFRGTPLMLQLFFVYYGLPLLNIFGYNFPIFNISDICIVIGATLLIVAIISGEDKNGSKSKKSNKKRSGKNTQKVAVL